MRSVERSNTPSQRAYVTDLKQFHILWMRQFKDVSEKLDNITTTRCTRGVRVVFSVIRMRSSNSARINKFDFRTEKSCSVHMTVFEIVAGHLVVNWMQLLT